MNFWSLFAILTSFFIYNTKTSMKISIIGVVFKFGVGPTFSYYQNNVTLFVIYTC